MIGLLRKVYWYNCGIKFVGVNNYFLFEVMLFVLKMKLVMVFI